ncbi:hypothetical protein KPL47_08510 [Clostridium estertheticum]|uniref:DUF3226 domain-containing protein n=1 Tax=Clostridium estertheticum TaxID=238834 RepID=UPI001C0ADBDD|nr:DUF3226 domain-containing protein [Clostridium estertheticum]MBU3176414.1 hypothetical protein [Clostridium estertheticum]
MENYLFIVEGAHDIAFLGKMLNLLKFKEIKEISNLSPLMEKFIPNKFPFYKDKLNIFNFIPFFYKLENKQIVIINANGEENLLDKLDVIMNELELDEIRLIKHIVIFADGDLKNRIEKIDSILNVDFENKEYEFFNKENLNNQRAKLNIYNKFEIGLDYYIFPDNNSAGRLEDIIIDGIKNNDMNLLNSAEKFISEVEQEYKSSWNAGNSKEEKAMIGIVGNILVPGAGNTSLLYNKNVKWISEEVKDKVPYVKKIHEFLSEIIGLV